MTKNRETFRGYKCGVCGEEIIMICGPLPNYCDCCGADLTNSSATEEEKR